MEKKKKTIIVAIVIALIAIVSIIIFFTIKGNNKNGQASKLSAYYEKLKNTNSYSFYISLDDQNNISYQKQNDKAYVNTNYGGVNSKFIIRDGNTYLIRDDDKKYYTYENNETELYMIESILNNIKDKELTKGKENIENKNYYYEEFEGTSEFYFRDMNDIDVEEFDETEENDNKTKTRFYFNNNNLVYIKTIIDDNTQQLLKVDYSKKVDDNLVNLPQDYEEI